MKIYVQAQVDRRKHGGWRLSPTNKGGETNKSLPPIDKSLTKAVRRGPKDRFLQ
jgi:hypothetical protein